MRLEKQMDFIKKLDWMKTVIRRTKLISEDRYENDAEHSFHIAAMAYLLREYAPEGCDISRSICMLLFHDVVEIEAGDTFAYDKKANETKKEREMEAAVHLFGRLPKDQSKDLLNLWLEFEDQETPESNFALVMDRLQPIFLNALNQGGSWKENEICKEDVLARIQVISKTSPRLYEFALKLLDQNFPSV